MVNKLKLGGKIGVYGRSLGGLSACHLANKYPEIIKALIADRTFSDLEIVSQRRILGWQTSHIYRMISCFWQTKNHVNFAKAKCFKIIASD